MGAQWTARFSQAWVRRRSRAVALGVHRMEGREHVCCRSVCGGLNRSVLSSGLHSFRGRSLRHWSWCVPRMGACMWCRSITYEVNVVATPICWIAPRCDPTCGTGEAGDLSETDSEGEVLEAPLFGISREYRVFTRLSCTTGAGATSMPMAMCPPSSRCQFLSLVGGRVLSA